MPRTRPNNKANGSEAHKNRQHGHLCTELIAMTKPCSAYKCNEVVVARGWCDRHYKRWQRSLKPKAIKATPVERAIANFWQRVDKDGPNGCWIWTGSIRHGYGLLRIGQHQVMAHRFSYMLNVGMVPQSFVIDHLCCNKQCVNPDHLEPVTNQENIQRAVDRRKAS